MTVRFLILGKAINLREVCEIPCLGEILTLDEVDFVVSNIRLQAETIGAKVIAHLNLLPVCRVESESG